MVSVDGAKTWSTWYNQPTAQIYHVAADNRFPYWLYGAQQDSGQWAYRTWSRMGTLTFRDWEPTCLAGESNTVVPDPKDGKLLYGGGDQRCNQETEPARARRRQTSPTRSGRPRPPDLDLAPGLLARRPSPLLLQSIRVPIARPW